MTTAFLWLLTSFFLSRSTHDVAHVVDRLVPAPAAAVVTSRAPRSSPSPAPIAAKPSPSSSMATTRATTSPSPSWTYCVVCGAKFAPRMKGQITCDSICGGAWNARLRTLEEQAQRKLKPATGQ